MWGLWHETAHGQGYCAWSSSRKNQACLAEWAMRECISKKMPIQGKMNGSLPYRLMLISSWPLLFLPLLLYSQTKFHQNNSSWLLFLRADMQCPPTLITSTKLECPTLLIWGLTSPRHSHIWAFVETPSTLWGPCSAQGDSNELNRGPWSQRLSWRQCYTITHSLGRGRAPVQNKSKGVMFNPLQQG